MLPFSARLCTPHAQPQQGRPKAFGSGHEGAGAGAADAATPTTQCVPLLRHIVCERQRHTCPASAAHPPTRPTQRSASVAPATRRPPSPGMTECSPRPPAFLPPRPRLLDYKSSLGELTGEAREEALRRCHQRGADRLLQLCFANGGIYTKLGQHIGQLVGMWVCGWGAVQEGVAARPVPEAGPAHRAAGGYVGGGRCRRGLRRGL